MSDPTASPAALPLMLTQEDWHYAVSESSYVLEGALADSLNALDDSALKDPAVRKVLAELTVATATANLLTSLRSRALESVVLALVPSDKRQEVKKTLESFDAMARKEVEVLTERMAS